MSRKATNEMRERRKLYPLTTIEHQAYCAMQWLSGLTQRDIAVQFGFDGAPQVNIAIEKFIRRMGGNTRRSPRRSEAWQALAKFLVDRGMPAPTEYNPFLSVRF